MRYLAKKKARLRELAWLILDIIRRVLDSIDKSFYIRFFAYFCCKCHIAA